MMAVDTGLRRNQSFLRNVVEVVNFTPEPTTEDEVGHSSFMAGVRRRLSPQTGRPRDSDRRALDPRIGAQDPGCRPIGSMSGCSGSLLPQSLLGIPATTARDPCHHCLGSPFPSL